MSEEKRSETPDETKSGTSEQGGERPGNRGSASSRARNQTVMLSPELTGQVRSLLNRQDTTQGPDPLSELLPPVGWERPVQPAVSSARNPNADYGGNVAQESETAAETKRPTGKMKGPEQGASSAGHPSFTINPNVARPTAGQASGGAVQQKAPKSKVVGFFVSFDKNPLGEVFEVRVGRWLLTSRTTDHGDNILIDDESVSPLHAIVRATAEGKLQVLDQLSEFGTGITRVGAKAEEEVAGAMVNLAHGDLVRFGKRNFVVCVVPKFGKDGDAA